MLNKFLPSRQKQKSSRDLSPVMVADLDALLTKTVTFKFMGKVHTIEPLSVEQFLEFSNAYMEVLDLKDQEKVTPDELIAAYSKMIGSICKTVTPEHIRAATQFQVSALFQIMVDLHTGRLFADEKKSLEKVQSLLNLPSR